MRPTSDTALSRPDLGQAIYETLENAPTMGFVGLQMMPIFRVMEQSADYPVIPKESLFNLLDTKRGPYGHYNRYTGVFEAGYYRTSENGLERPVDDRFKKLYESKFQYELTISNILMQDILRAQEMRIKDKLFNTTNFTAHNVSVAWSTEATAAPKADIETAKAALRANGIIPNCLLIPYAQFQNLQIVADIKTQVYQLFPDAAKTGQITVNHLKTYFDVEQIIIAGGLYNSANQNQNATLADIWGNRYAMLCRVATTGQDISEPCVGRTFLWNEGEAQSVIVEGYYSDEVRAQILRVRHDTSEALLASMDDNGSEKSAISKACGYLLDCTAAS